MNESPKTEPNKIGSKPGDTGAPPQKKPVDGAHHAPGALPSNDGKSADKKSAAPPGEPKS